MRLSQHRWILGGITLLASLLLARVHPFGDPGLHQGKTGQAPFMDYSAVPPEVRATLLAKCADCHSLRTRTPFYIRLAPASWLMEHDIIAGRKAMNLSQWDAYSTEMQQTLKAKIVQEAKSGEMPLPQYRLIHSSARITDADLHIFARWAHGPSSGESISVSQSQAGDPVKGKEVFEKRCTGCHSLTQNREGPRLQGIYGRSAASIPGYNYSLALKSAHLVWDDATLGQWLADPDQLVPGNNMEFRVAKASERLDLIRFLQKASTR
jgi:cytochrome c